MTYKNKSQLKLKFHRNKEYLFVKNWENISNSKKWKKRNKRKKKRLNKKVFEKIESEVNSFFGTSAAIKLATLSYASVLSSGFEKSKKLPKPNNDMYSGIGYTVSKALQQAKHDERLVVGLSQAVKTLSNEPEDTIFCVLAQPKPGDSATHMQVILLEAYCYENGIYTIKVDSLEKMSCIADATKLESCVLIQRHKYDDAQPQHKLKFLELEERLIDHCEDYWDAQHQPVIRLPDE